MIVLEVIAAISTILCVVLTAKQRVSCWPMGIISVLSLIGIYLIEGLYAQIILQSVFLIQCIIGWWNWGSTDDLKVSKLNITTFLWNVSLFVCIGMILAQIDIVYNHRTTCIPSYVDCISALLALLGNWYLTKKIIQAWPLFMTYNVLIIALLVSKDMYILASMNLILFFTSLNGYFLWRKDLKEV